MSVQETSDTHSGDSTTASNVRIVVSFPAEDEASSHEFFFRPADTVNQLLAQLDEKWPSYHWENAEMLVLGKSPESDVPEILQASMQLHRELELKNLEGVTLHPLAEPKEEGDKTTITVMLGLGQHAEQRKFELWDGATLDDLFLVCEADWPELDWEKAKALLDTKDWQALKREDKDTPMALTAAKHGAFPLEKLNGKKVRLQAPQMMAVESLNAAGRLAAAEQARRSAALSRARASQATRARNHRSANPDDAKYTFQVIRPLPNLNRPERSLEFLKRLAADPGIKAAMRKHKFQVGLLTEMDPASYTESNHEGTTRILGLNRNQGEVIELRLRTDAYDGYRDYKTIRKTLCHELAHNVHGPHDRNFWDLCHQIEREVHDADWKSGGHAVGAEEFAPSHEEDAMDHGGWSGGEFVLGGSSGGAGSAANAGLTRREIIAKAAEERMKKLQQSRGDATGRRDDEGAGSGTAGGSGSA